MIRRIVTAVALIVAAGSLLFVAPGHADSTGCESPKPPPKVTPVPPKPATFSPPRASATMANGTDLTLGFTLFHPAAPTPVDIYFLVDTTGSMQSAICGVQHDLGQIAIDVAKAGINSRFGVGSFRDYPFPSWGAPGDWAYKRIRDIGPLNSELLESLHSLEAKNGGDWIEAGGVAVYQSATGIGQDVAPAGASEGDIAPGQQAHFRTTSLKLLVTVTDSDFREPGPDEVSDEKPARPYPGPAFAKIARALKRRGILAAAIAISGGGRDSLEHLARVTGAVAPKGGADCDGDGIPDLGRGDPLVCDGEADDTTSGGSAAAVKMAPAIVSFVKALRDETPVTYRITGATDIVTSYAPKVLPGVDLKHDASLPLSISLHCGRKPGRKKMTIEGIVRGKTIATALLNVVCDPPIEAALSVVRAAPPAPTAQQPAQQPNPQPNPQAGIAAAPAQQEQLALAQAYDASEDGVGRMEAVLARRRNAGGAAAAVALMGGAGIAGAFAFKQRRSFIDGRNE